MTDKKLFKLSTTLPSGNIYSSNDVFKVEPEKMAHNMATFREKFKDIKIKFRSTVVDKCDDPDYLVEGDAKVVKKMGLAIAAALQVEAKIQYGEELIVE